MQSLIDYLNSPISGLKRVGIINDSDNMMALYIKDLEGNRQSKFYLGGRLLFVQIDKYKFNEYNRYVVNLVDLNEEDDKSIISSNPCDNDFYIIFKNLETLAGGKNIKIKKQNLDILPFMYPAIIKKLFGKINKIIS